METIINALLTNEHDGLSPVQIIVETLEDGFIEVLSVTCPDKLCPGGIDEVMLELEQEIEDFKNMDLDYKKLRAMVDLICIDSKTYNLGFDARLDKIRKP